MENYIKNDGGFIMDNISAFLQHLVDIGKKQTYIDMSRELLDSFNSMLGNEQPFAGVIDNFVRGRWSGYVSRDRATYKILNEYADFVKTESPLFFNAFREHICDTFEGEARKAMRVYKNSIVYIPRDTKITPSFLGGLTNDDFVAAYKALQELIYAVYDCMESIS